MDNTLIISRGTAAAELLKTEAFAVVVNELYNQYLGDITSSPMEAKELRETRFYQLRALQDITTELNSWVQAKDQLFEESND